MQIGEHPSTPHNSLAGSLQTFSCPNCGGSINIRAAGISISAVCQNCKSVVDISNENLRVIQQATKKTMKSDIPIGARAILFHDEWEVIGYMVRSDKTQAYTWREYLLFNPYQGFRYLVESDGHWNFVKMLRQIPEEENKSKQALFDGKKYRLYVSDQAIVQYVMGEFYWRVEIGERSKTVDYIAPPHMLSKENAPGDIIWSQALYIPYATIVEAFKLPSLPRPRGVAPNQPGPYDGKLGSILKMFGMFVAALFVIQLFLSVWCANKVIYDRQVKAPASYRGQLLLSEPLTLTGGTSNVELWARSPVSNNWVELDATLVNDATQETEDATIPIEYYSGYDSDGSWSEGGQTSDVMFSAVPDGNYTLQIEPDAGAFSSGQPVDLEIKLTRDKALWSNFWLAIGLLMAYPLWAMIRHWQFENRRWSNSDHAPALYRVEFGESDDSE